MNHEKKKKRLKDLNPSENLQVQRIKSVMSLDFRFDPTNELESKGEKVKGHKIFRSLIPSVTRVPTD